MSHDFLNKNNIMLYLSVVLATLLLNLFTTSAPHGGSPSGSDIEEYREREREREREHVPVHAVKCPKSSCFYLMMV